MTDNRNTCHGLQPQGIGPGRKDTVCISCNRILDSCRDKDCFEDVRVYLTDFGQEVIEKTNNVRVKSAKIVSSNIVVEPVPFNRGFYQVTCRLYTKLCIEACLCLGKSQEIEGIAVTEKKVVLFGGEGNVRIFSSKCEDSFCSAPKCEEATNEPVAVLEVIDPVVLSAEVKEKCKPHVVCCFVHEFPQSVCNCINGNLSDYSNSPKNLYVTLGFFSVIRLERPGQFVVNAADFCVPEKVCLPCAEEDPCAAFEKMPFPINEFCPCSTYPTAGFGGCNDFKK